MVILLLLSIANLNCNLGGPKKVRATVLYRCQINDTSAAELKLATGMQVWNVWSSMNAECGLKQWHSRIAHKVTNGSEVIES